MNKEQKKKTIPPCKVHEALVTFQPYPIHANASHLSIDVKEDLGVLQRASHITFL